MVHGSSGDASGPLARFCARLMELQKTSKITQVSLAATVHLGTSQMSDILNGNIKKLPDRDVMIAIVRACLAHAEAKGNSVPGNLRDEGDWCRRYDDVEHDLDAAPRPRLHDKASVGWWLTEVTDPFDLEVHRPLRVDGPQRELPALPAYVPREHDQTLAEVVQDAVVGRSGIAVLVGGSSTGKTRACWEALEPLRAQTEQWRLWHPIDPSRPQAALRGLSLIGRRTVIWLNEAQEYLNPSDGLGEEVAAGLRTLLRDSTRAPVLVLATLWGEHWNTLAARPAEGANDAHAQARELLKDRDISVPSAFTGEQVRQILAAADPRLSQAAEMAEDGQVVQFLAGAPALLARYRHAPATAAALIAAAMDARRLGMGIALPLAFLEQAAPGYLTDAEWDQFGTDGWLQRALDYTEQWHNGIRGPLTPIRPRPGDPEAAGAPPYRLADYLEQHGRHSRRGVIPPTRFWNAAHHGAPDDLPTLAQAAADRGLLRAAAGLRRHAVAHGSSCEAAILVRDLHALHPHDPLPAQWASTYASVHDPRAVADLLDALRSTGADDRQVAMLADRAAAGVPLDEPIAVARLLDALRLTGQDRQFTDLADRAAASAPLHDPIGVGSLLKALQKGGASRYAAALADRAAADITLDKPHLVKHLLQVMRSTDGLGRQFAVLATRAANGVSLHNPYTVAGLLRQFLWASATQQITVLVHRNPAANVTLDNPESVSDLLSALEEVGADRQCAILAARAAIGMPLHDANSIGHLLYRLLRTGASDRQLAVLAARAAVSVDLNKSHSLEFLLGAFNRVGAEAQFAVLVDRAVNDPCAAANLSKALWMASVDWRFGALADRQFAVLAARAAASVPLRDPHDVAELVGTLHMVAAFRQDARLPDRYASAKGAARRQIVVLVDRNPAASVALDDPRAVVSLLYQLWVAGAGQQVEALADRAAVGVPLRNPRDVEEVLRMLRRVGAERQIAVLVDRNPAATVSLDDTFDVEGMPISTGGAPSYPGGLPSELREVGAEQQRAILVSRLPAEGRFRFFLRTTGSEQRYRFGREPDGSEAPEWRWTDLDRPAGP